MTRLIRASCPVLGALLVLSCSGRTEVEVLHTDPSGTDAASDAPVVSPDAPDAPYSPDSPYAPDAADSAQADSAPDQVNPPEAGGDALQPCQPINPLCKGPSHLLYGPSSAICQVQVTSTPLVLNCCDYAVEFYLHCDSFQGTFRVSLIDHTYPFPTGSFCAPIDTSVPTPVWVAVTDGRPQMPSMEVLGSLEWSWDDGSGKSFHINLCGQISAPGDVIDGTVFWVNQGIFVKPYPPPELGVSIRLLENKSINAIDAAKQPLDSLALDSVALLELTSMDYYEWPQHRVAFWPGAGKVLEPYKSQVGLQGLPFVVVADGKRKYVGAFWTSLSSMVFYGPQVVMENVSEDGMTIEAPMSGVDPRSDPSIEKALVDTGKALY
ncbi:MAG: hypothetical protein HY898_09610 [Deltaproteobacteria bacterium]|nr:hypothetical protein [Deltaproteobacteria bacterium]